MNRGAVRLALVTLAVLVLPSRLYAEVMDKEPTVTSLWVRALVVGVLGLLAWRRHLALGALTTLVAAVLVWGFHWELTDPYVGASIRQEAGQGYITQAYAGMLVCALLHLAGVGAFIRRHRGPRDASLPEVAGQRTMR
jgi:hypothetical protein